MIVTESARMAVKSVLDNKLRSLLTMLGIIIGVFALVVLVSRVNGATSYVTDTISNLGGSYLTVDIADDKGKPVRLEELYDFMEEDSIGLAAPLGRTTAMGKYARESGSVVILGTTPLYKDINSLKLKTGTFLHQTDVDNHNYVAVINETAASELIGTTDCVGLTLTLDGSKFQVIGVI